VLGVLSFAPFAFKVQLNRKERKEGGRKEMQRQMKFGEACHK
jgi:hypothetical protein